MTKNIFVEGLQGMGKSTLLRKLADRFPDYHIYAEGDLCPVELAWCSYMTKEEYIAVLKKYPDIEDEIRNRTKEENGHYVVAYTRIITDYPGFHKYMEGFEIYNGRRNFEEFKSIIFERLERFKGDKCLFECAFLQNIVEDLILFHQVDDDAIIDFYKGLFSKVDKDNFLLLYLDSDAVEENVLKIKKERSDACGNEMWYPLMISYLKESTYGKVHGYTEFSHLIKHLKHRQAVERRIIKEVIRDNAIILPAKEWTEEMLP